MPPKQGKASLLLVDDDPDLLRLLSIRLKANGYDVTAVDSAQRALASIANSRPDVVLTDLRMEGMDGMALFDEIQASYPGLPVIILTAHGTIPEAVGAVKRGVFARPRGRPRAGPDAGRPHGQDARLPGLKRRGHAFPVCSDARRAADAR